MWSAFPRNLCPSTHIGGQVLMSEGQTCSHRRTFTMNKGEHETNHFAVNLQVSNTVNRSRGGFFIGQ